MSPVFLLSYRFSQLWLFASAPTGVSLLFSRAGRARRWLAAVPAPRAPFRHGERFRAEVAAVPGLHFCVHFASRCRTVRNKPGTLFDTHGTFKFLAFGRRPHPSISHRPPLHPPSSKSLLFMGNALLVIGMVSSTKASYKFATFVRRFTENGGSSSSGAGPFLAELSFAV